MTETGLRGVFNILATPFTADLGVDTASIGTLVDGVLATGVDGVTVLGVAGEAHRLNAEERSLVVATAVEAVAGRVPVYVGASHDDTATVVQAGTEARKLGAAGLMIAPPKGWTAGEALTAHYREVADSVGLPIVLQDFPAASGVDLTPEQMAELVAAVPLITTIKLESLPTPVRTARTRALLPPGRTILGGMGGMYLLDELRHGSAGTMTGFAYTEALIDICRAWADGDVARAKSTYTRFLRLLVFEQQAGVGLAVRKEILRRRGFIADGSLRQPGQPIDELTAADLTELLADLGLAG
ncbi:dihydrodipicolinate synthetase [Actinoplanes sp. SE50]|uniref:dihydrodipicolinate synthase family protein n=1 Tax=unclassified Actinoplanes TaxID=2626549 RepID=UPI00023EBEB9|nr:MULTISPECIES: dihydrodipicolinate synthase family protein [unclassified Actinoplanes]AEV82935.1 dihydrodipicolinate synthase [Actinoplanes sp. SE50/110]ATO81331.1 dihydrodipicolinate synthetase [Actinoplanes sp. SE50]SLL98738.1 dihydrodipicolinate synthase family protein [Actinoplanes sp. SE50/110]